MEVRKDYKAKGAELSAILELEEQYKNKGFKTFREYRIDDFLCDLYAENGEEKYVFEFKAGRISPEVREHLEHIRKKLTDKGIRFRVVMVTMPKPKNIIVDGIEQTIFEYFLNNMPDKLDQLSTNTIIDEIDTVDINYIEIRSASEIIIKGESSVSVDLHYDGDDEDNFSLMFPFTFKGLWRFDEQGSLSLEELLECDIDTSEF